MIYDYANNEIVRINKKENIQESSDIISITKVFKTFGKIKALQGISFTVQRGDIFGYLGPNGAGKTTTIRIILGLLKPDSGQATILGNPSINLPSWIKRKIGVVLESDGLYPYLSAEKNLIFFGKIYGLPEKKIHEKVKNLLRFAELYDRRDDLIVKFSRGMKRRLALARALLNDPEIIICDELTAGLDPSQQQIVRQLIKRIATESGTTIFFSSHNLDEVQKICNRVAIINHGKLLLCGFVKEILSGLSQESTIFFSFPSNDETECAIKILKLLKNEISNMNFERISIQEVKVNISNETDISRILKAFIQEGIHIKELRRSYQSLEELYFKVIEGNNDE